MTKYSSDLTGTQYRLIYPSLPRVKKTRPRKYSQHDLLNGIFYILSNGCKWRELPKDYPSWYSVYKYFQKLRVLRVIDKILFNLNKTKDKQLRKRVRRYYHNYYILIVDSQSVRSTSCLSKLSKGKDQHKKIKGIKRFILCDYYGLIYCIHITKANVSEKTGLREMIQKVINLPIPKKFKSILADKGFESKALVKEIKTKGFSLFCMKTTKWFKKNTQTDKEQISYLEYLNKQISSFRWKIEQVFAHLDNARRIVINYERKNKTHEGFVKLRAIALLLKELG